MRVIGAGWGRTGTTTAAAALELLGFGPAVQMQTMWDEPALAEAWAAHCEGAPTDFRRLLAGYGSSTDWPGCGDWELFADLWPAAKVLLTLRDPDAWHASFMRSVYAWTEPGEEIGPPAVHTLLGRMWTVDLGSREQAADRELATARFRAHEAHVRATCPPERLVEWDVRDGWEPLCTGLGVEVPDEPLPHLNASG